MHPPSIEYDTALETIHRHGPNLSNGFINHAPMVVEAMSRLGHGRSIPAWIEGEREHFTMRPAAIETIDDAGTGARIGDFRLFADWSDYFERACRENGWQTVLDEWSHRLAPGFTTAACHGVLRTAHAARALAADESRVRIRELAEGLASWASMYSALPVEAKGGAGEVDLGLALAALDFVPEADRPGVGPITAGYDSIRFATGFSQQVADGDLSGPIGAKADELVGLFAGEFVRCAHSPFLAIVFAHAVTGVAAVRNLQPFVSTTTSTTLLFRSWEAGCALRAAFGAEPSTTPTRPRASCNPDVDVAVDVAALAQRAVAHGDDHVVKLCEACLATHARTSDPVLIEAVLHSLDTLACKPWSSIGS